MALSLEQLLALKKHFANQSPKGAQPTRVVGMSDGGETEPEASDTISHQEAEAELWHKRQKSGDPNYPSREEVYNYINGGKNSYGPAYSDGGSVDPSDAATDEDKEAFSKVFNPSAKAKPKSEMTQATQSNPPGAGSAEDIADAAEQKTRAEYAAKHSDDNEKSEADRDTAYADGGEVDDSDEDGVAEETEAAAPEATAEAPLTSTLGEQLASKDPDALDLHKLLEAGRRSSIEAPYDAAEAAKQAKVAEYSKLFGKQAAQDIVDQASSPGKTAAESAETLLKAAAPEVAEEGGKAALKAALLGSGEKAAGKAAVGDLLGPAAGLLVPNETAATEDSEEKPIPGTDKSIKGQDIVPTSLMYRGDKPDLAHLIAISKALRGDDIADATKKSPASDGSFPLPNGGMSGQTLQDYIKAHSGQSTPPSDQDEEEIAMPSKAAPKPASSGEDEDEETPSAPSSKPSQAPAASQQDSIAALLKSLGMPAPGDLKAAQAQQADAQRNLALEMGGDTIARAFARGRGAQMAVPTEYYNQMNAMGEQPVKNIMAQQAVVKDALDSGMKASDLMDKNQMRNGSSPVSQAYRSMALTWNPALAKNPNFQNMDAEGIKQLLPGIDMQMKMSYMQQMRSEANEAKMQQLSQKQQQDSLKAGSDMTTKFGSMMRRRDLANAADADRRVDNLMDIVNQYPDLNSMPQAQVNLAMKELDQIASGGRAHEGSTSQLMAPTLQSKINQLVSQGEGSIKGADLGQFMQEYLPYMEKLQQNSRSYIAGQLSPIARSYKGRVDPDTMNDLMNGDENYGKYFKAVKPQAASQMIQQRGLTSGVAPSISGVNPQHGPGPDASGNVRIKDPQGHIRLIPQDQVKDAIAAGGSLVGQP